MRRLLAVMTLACAFSMPAAVTPVLPGLTAADVAQAAPRRHSRRHAKRLHTVSIARLRLASERVLAARRKAASERAKAAKLGRERDALRREIAALRLRLWGAAPLIVSPVARTVLPAPSLEAALIHIPDAREFADLPAAPVGPSTASLPQPEIVLPPKRTPTAREPRLFGRTIQQATDYLIATATAGGTMRRQGAALAIGRLHPMLRLRLAEGVARMRRAGHPRFGIFSAYRPTGYGVGGFRNKDCSGHSYGLASDMVIRGGPGSREARRWSQVVRDVGLHLPYGFRNRAEYNHTQLVARRSFCGMHATITKRGPKNLARMWAASGVGFERYGPFATARVADRPRVRRVSERRR